MAEIVGVMRDLNQSPLGVGAVAHGLFLVPVADPDLEVPPPGVLAEHSAGVEVSGEGIQLGLGVGRLAIERCEVEPRSGGFELEAAKVLSHNSNDVFLEALRHDHRALGAPATLAVPIYRRLVVGSAAGLADQAVAAARAPHKA